MLGLTGGPVGYPVVSLCPGDSLALGLQAWPLHVGRQIIDGVDSGLGQLITLVPFLDCCLVSPPLLSCPYHQGEFYSITMYT